MEQKSISLVIVKLSMITFAILLEWIVKANQSKNWFGKSKIGFVLIHYWFQIAILLVLDLENRSGCFVTVLN